MFSSCFPNCIADQTLFSAAVTILIETLINRTRRKNLKRWLRLMRYCLIPRNGECMTSLGKLGPSKVTSMAEAPVDSIFNMEIHSTSLKRFSEEAWEAGRMFISSLAQGCRVAGRMSISISTISSTISSSSNSKLRACTKMMH